MIRVRNCFQVVLFGLLSALGHGRFAVLTEALSSTTTTNAKKKTAIVVGGGPVGLATALTLSNAPHYYDVTVLEQALVEQYDPTKAYLYNINKRGQRWMEDNFPSVLSKLQDRGSAGGIMRNLIVIPSDPHEPIPKKTNVVMIPPKKEDTATTTTTRKRKGYEPRPLDKPSPDNSYWIPRHTMICLLQEEIEEQQEQRSNIGKIQLVKGKQFRSLEPIDNDNLLQVTVQDTIKENSSTSDLAGVESFAAKLVVAADGYNSAVRNWLASDKMDKVDETTTWLQSQAKRFRIKKWVTPATGLRMKILQMPPKFTIPNITSETPDKGNHIEERLVAENEQMYAFQGANTGPRDRARLGFLPVKDPDMIRPGNVITRPNHDVWKLKSGPEAKSWFQKAFPRFNWDEYIDDTEWERFAQAQGTTFPYCQYSPGLQISQDGDDGCGVVLVGDASHAFPPDCGQGINAGFCDVLALDRALCGKDIITGKDNNKDTPKLSTALMEYERVQGPIVKGLIRLARFGFPYQYRQSLYKDRIGRVFSVMNVSFRLILNKLSLGVIPPASIMLMNSRYDLTYNQVMRRCDLTTFGIFLSLVLCAKKLLL